MKSTDGWFRNSVAMDVCTSVGGSSAKQTRLTALIAVIPDTYVVSPPVCLSPNSHQRFQPLAGSPSTLRYPTSLVVRARSTYLRGQRDCLTCTRDAAPVYMCVCVCGSVSLCRGTCVRVPVLTRWWIVTTVGNTRLNTLTIVVIERDDVFSLFR